MRKATPVSLNLPWNQAKDFWLTLALPAGTDSADFAPQLQSLGFSRAGDGNYFLLHMAGPWAGAWGRVSEFLHERHLWQDAQLSFIAGDKPDQAAAAYNRKTADAIAAIADSLWLGEALIQGRLSCHLQPLVDKRGSVVGYESFARLALDGGEVIGGGRIIAAGKALGIEHILDRYLHVHALKTYLSGDLHGFLFVNFMTGFIHRPAIYLEGLSEAVLASGMAAKNIALDFTQSETARDIAHLRSIFDYCRSKGYLTSMDDIASVDMARRLVHDNGPDFLKLDIGLVRKCLEPREQAVIAQLVELAHTRGCLVIAEGVETEEVHKELLKVGVDLFQGYLFSAPAAVQTPQQKAALQ